MNSTDAPTIFNDYVNKTKDQCDEHFNFTMSGSPCRFGIDAHRIIDF